MGKVGMEFAITAPIQPQNLTTQLCLIRFARKSVHCNQEPIPGTHWI